MSGRAGPPVSSGCICYSYQIQYEDQPGDFYDPEVKLPKTPDGVKYRYMHYGCPWHNGYSSRHIPAAPPRFDLERRPEK